MFRRLLYVNSHSELADFFDATRYATKQIAASPHPPSCGIIRR